MPATTWTELRSGIATAINSIDDIGNVVVRQAIPKDWISYLNTFKATIDGRDQIRGWVVLPGHPFRTTEVDAVGGNYQDNYNFVLIGFQSAKDENESFHGALDRSIQVTDVLDAKQTYGLSGGASVFFAGPCQIRSHEFRMYGNVGVWYTEVLFDVTVNRERVTYV